MTPEGAVKHRVKKVLASFEAYWFMPVGNGMGAPSLDFIGCHRGRCYAIETKAGNKDMTDRQKMTANAMRAAGAAIFLINDQTGTGELECWLKGEMYEAEDEKNN